MRIGLHIAAVLATFLMGAGLASAAEPTVKYDHKNLAIHLKMNFKTFVTWEKRMPRSLRREIGEDYYPYLRTNLVDVDTLHYKAAQVAVDRHEDDTITLSMEFPNYYLVFSDVTWEMMDGLYSKYFTK